jgi:uncharacterized protein YjiS (DUF1127 family)
MNRIFKLVLAALAAAQEQRARQATLGELDAHTLRDIGLEAEAGLARRRAAVRERLQFGVHS